MNPSARQEWMGCLARSADGAAAALLQGSGVPTPDFTWLRPPEIGAIMVRGRTGGSGAPFNVGEMTVCRCSLTLSCGTVGHGYVQGRDKAKAQTAALIDALMQTDAAARIRTAVLDPLQAREAQRRAQRAAKAAATKVEFFTLARGED